jgi:hypothetical protein
MLRAERALGSSASILGAIGMDGSQPNLRRASQLATSNRANFARALLDLRPPRNAASGKERSLAVTLRMENSWPTV